MPRWRSFATAGAVLIAAAVCIWAVLAFLAPDLSYQIKDRARELVSGRGDRRFRIALGSSVGSSYRIGSVLDRYLEASRGYGLEPLVTASPGNLGSLLDPAQHIDLAIINSADDDAVRAEGVYGIAALEPQYFFVIVPNESAVQEFRDLAGAVNPGVREANQPPTLGERILEHYGLVSGAATPGGAARVSVVRPQKGNVADFDAGVMAAATRTQSLQSELIDRILDTGRFRLVPIRDHDALARSFPGTSAGFIPSGFYGPGRRIPPEPVPTLTVRQLLVARGDVPGRVIRDILEVIYNPRFGRDIQYELTEASGRAVGGLPLHPAADIYYRRNDLVTSDRLGRVSFVASIVAALFAGGQFVSRFRRADRVRQRRRLLGSELGKLQAIRDRIESAADRATARALIREADDLLGQAEQDAAADLLDANGIESLRSLHRLCWNALRERHDPLDGSLQELVGR